MTVAAAATRHHRGRCLQWGASDALYTINRVWIRSPVATMAARAA